MCCKHEVIAAHVVSKTRDRYDDGLAVLHPGRAAYCPRCIEHDDESDCPDPSRCAAHKWVTT